MIFMLKWGLLEIVFQMLFWGRFFDILLMIYMGRIENKLLELIDDSILLVDDIYRQFGRRVFRIGLEF